MSVNAFSQSFPPPLSKLVDDDQTATDFWQTFFLQIWNRTGQANGIIPVISNVTATGSTINDAFALTTDWNDVSNVAAGTGVGIPPIKPGQDILIFNSGANVLDVYPPTGMRIDALAVGAPYALASGKMQIFRAFSLTQMRSTQWG